MGDFGVEDFGEGDLPVHGAGVDGDVIDEGVSAVDVVVEVGEGFAGACGANPECEACDFDGLFGEIDAVEIFLKDGFGILLAELCGIGDTLSDHVAGDVIVEVVEEFIGGDKERTGAAGGIDDFEMA